MKILISGGHLTPALAFIEYIQRAHTDDTMVFVGRQFSQDKIKQRSQEETEIGAHGVPFVDFIAPRANRFSVFDTVLYPLRLIISVAKAIGIVASVKPDVYVSFGSYMSVPLSVACFVLRVPVVTHEQTRAVGEATKFVARLAKKIAVTYSNSATYLPTKKTVVTGNPLRRSLFVTQSKPSWIPATPTKPILYITGGNQGSEIINSMVQQSMKQLTKSWFVVHQCGAATRKRNYLNELSMTQSQLPLAHQADYVVKEWISETELGWILKHASVVVARSGANTVQELAALAIPSVLIPLPFAHHDEQTLNAKFIADAGGAVVLLQKDLSPTALVEHIEKVQKYGKSMRQKLKALHIPLDGAEKLYDVVSGVVSL